MDDTEHIRKIMQNKINEVGGNRTTLEQMHGQVWDTDELKRDFDVLGFLAPFIGVRRKSDGKKGSLMFQHDPRYYFNFKED